MRLARRLSLLLAACLVIPAAAAHAKPAVVSCGEVITHDTTVANDLVDCPGTGLVVGADGVNIDLAGHLVDGTNAPGSDGITVDGHSGATVRNGTIREFRVNGIGFHDAPGGDVRHVDISTIGAGGQEGEDVSAGVFAFDSDGLDVDHSSVSNAVEAFQADGIVVIRSAHARIRHTDASDNAFNGIVLDESPDSRVTDSHAAGNANHGIFVVSSSSVMVEHNLVEDQVNDDTTGILVLASDHLAVAGNRLRDNVLGIGLANGVTATRVVNNDVRGGGDGIGVLDSDDNMLVGNEISGAEGAGIFLDEAGGDGSQGNRLVANVASHNGFDGFYVGFAGNRLTANVANHNAEHGIEAVAGTIDGGGNRAQGNGALPECTGVVCH